MKTAYLENLLDILEEMQTFTHWEALHVESGKRILIPKNANMHDYLTEGETYQFRQKKI